MSGKPVFLSPTDQLKIITTRARGVGCFHPETRDLTLLIFDLPEPEKIGRDPKDNPFLYYRAWLLNNLTEKWSSLGVLQEEQGVFYLTDAQTPSLNKLEVGLYRYELIITAHSDQEDSDPGDAIVMFGFIHEPYRNYSGKLKRVEPFMPPLAGYRWWCINGIFELSLPQIIGYRFSGGGKVKHLVHGIPGKFHLNDQLSKGKTGYSCWKPLPRFQNLPYTSPYTWGYWLLHIDLENNRIAYPLGKTEAL